MKLSILFAVIITVATACEPDDPYPSYQAPLPTLPTYASSDLTRETTLRVPVVVKEGDHRYQEWVGRTTSRWKEDRDIVFSYPARGYERNLSSEEAKEYFPNRRSAW